MKTLPVEEVGTSDMVIVAAAVVGEVSGSMVRVDPVGHDQEAAGPEELVHLVAAVVAAAAAVGALAAAVMLAAVVAAPVLWVVGSLTGFEGPAEFGDLVLAAAEAVVVAGEGRRVAVLAENVGAGYMLADLEQDHGDLETVGRKVPTAHVDWEAVKGDPVECMEFQSSPGADQGMVTAAGQDEKWGHADYSSSDSAGRNHQALVHRLTST